MMEAKDTVMNQVKRDSIFYHGVGTLEGLCEEQAEISFEAGMREVVEWVEHNNTQGFPHHAWQAKLEEWGIKRVNLEEKNR